MAVCDVGLLRLVVLQLQGQGVVRIRRLFAPQFFDQCRRGEIGRHTILRGWRREPCEFESHRRHQSFQYLFCITPAQG